MMDELQLEELSIRRTQEKMDEAFCAAMQGAINAGTEYADRRLEAAGHQKSEECDSRLGSADVPWRRIPLAPVGTRSPC
jgi:hypothetical protein